MRKLRIREEAKKTTTTQVYYKWNGTHTENGKYKLLYEKHLKTLKYFFQLEKNLCIWRSFFLSRKLSLQFFSVWTTFAKEKLLAKFSSTRIQLSKRSSFFQHNSSKLCKMSGVSNIKLFISSRKCRRCQLIHSQRKFFYL